MTEPAFGITFTRDDTGAGPVVAADLSVIGLVGTAEAANAGIFPLDTPVAMSSGDPILLAALGADGTLPDALAGLNAQLVGMQVAARVVVVRVAEGDTDAATIAHLVGGAGEGSGLLALVRARPELGLVPRLIAVPGYTHQRTGDAANAVCAALPAICEALSAHAVVEGPGTNTAAILAWRETLSSARLVPVDAWVRVAEGESIVTRPGAPRVLGIAVRRDFERRGAPSRSWANSRIEGIVGLARTVDFSLMDGATAGQQLVAGNVGVAVRGELGLEGAAAGFVFIGTDTASPDPLQQFVHAGRMRDYLHLGLASAWRARLGKGSINARLIEAVIDDTLFWLRDLKADGHVLGYRVAFEPAANSAETLRAGRFRIAFAVEPPPVLRRIDADGRRMPAALEVLVAQLTAPPNDRVLGAWPVAAGAGGSGPPVVPQAAIGDAVLVAVSLPAATIADAILVAVEVDLPAASIADATLVDGPVGLLAASPSSLSFGTVDVDDTATLDVLITNTGDGAVTFSAISASGMFSVPGDVPEPLAPDDSITLTVTFAPTSSGAKAGALTIASDAGNSSFTVALAGTGLAEGDAVFPMRMHTSGNQILDENDAPFRIKAVNWFGMEGTNHVPHGLWERPYRAMIDQMQGMGFNALRIPFSGANASTDLAPQGIDPTDNPEFASAKAIEVLDAIIAYCGQIGMYVILDHHRRTAGAGADGSPISETYTEEDWHATWAFFAIRYGDDPVVLGADLHNEPHDLSWNAWADLAEDCAAAIHAIAPEWLIFVEGVGAYGGSSYWWGGALAGVADRPVVLGVANRLVYSPHEYGQSVSGSQPWLDYEWSEAPAGWPLNLYDVWHDNWGFIFEDGIAPIWIGEFGGHFGRDANTGLTGTTSNGAEEAEWVGELAKYLNGDLDGDGDSDLAEGQVGMSFAYWGYPPISGDTGGLVLSDWTTPQTYKLSLLAPLLT